MLFRSNDTATTETYTHANTLSLHDALPIETTGTRLPAADGGNVASQGVLTRQEIARTEAAGHRGEAGARMPCGRAERGRTHDDLLAFLLGAAYADCPK